MGIYLPALAFRQNEIFGYIGVHSLPPSLQALSLLIKKEAHKETSRLLRFFQTLYAH